MSETQARHLAALLTDRQKRDLMLLVRILNEEPVKEAGRI